MKLPLAKEMQRLDQTAIEQYGIPGIVLMENAGLGTVLMAEEKLGSCKNSFAPIFVGPGNNGGDGLVIGRHLYQRGCLPVFFFLIHPDNFKNDPQSNFEIIQKLKIPCHIVNNSLKAENIPIFIKQMESQDVPCFALFDAIFGIGLGRPVTGHFKDSIDFINSRKGITPIISADIPSGMDSDTGLPRGACVQADYTAAYGLAKPGHYINGSNMWTGQLRVIDIGIPPEVVNRAKIKTRLVDRQFLSQFANELNRKETSHKGSHGHLAILAGSRGKTGAAVLTARGALRGGAGLVSLITPHQLSHVFETNLPEIMTIPLDRSDTLLSIDDWELIAASLKGKSALAFGPGIGQHPKTEELTLKIYEEVTIPVVFDADALNNLAKNLDKLPPPKGPRIFTPHPGELGRILDISAREICEDRLLAARNGVRRFQDDGHEFVLVLKGAGSVTTDSKESAYINTTGNPGMATGGMGDVLTGIIGALICQGLGHLESALTGVYLHGAAGDALYKEKGSGFFASDVADMIPVVRKRIFS